MFGLNIKNNKGFTIIELMVAASVFLIIVALSMGVFIQTLRTQRTLTAVTAANESASQVLEQITRGARTGYNFVLSPDYKNANTLSFISANENNKTVTYSWGPCIAAAKNGVTNNCIKKNDGTTTSDITPPDTNIEKLKFWSSGVDPADSAPPRITILMTVGTRDTVNIETNLETTVSARNVSK